MKVAVINFSGNVGKSTLAAHLLLPRMPGAKIISVESLNLDARQDGVDVEQARGKQFLKLINEVMLRASVIVDVGASNAEDFMRGMKIAEGSHEEFDYFVVPSVASKKQLGDTLGTIEALSVLGVPSRKIRVLLNKVEDGDELLSDFAAIFRFAENGKAFVANALAAVAANEVFDRIKGAGMSLAEVRNDQTPWREMVHTASSEADRNHALAMLTIKRLSGSACKNLDSAYEALFA